MLHYIYLAVLVLLTAFTATAITHGLLLRLRWYRVATNNMLLGDYMLLVGGHSSPRKHMSMFRTPHTTIPAKEVVVQPRSPPCNSLPFGLLQMKGVRDRLEALRPSDTYPQATHEQ